MNVNGTFLHYVEEGSGEPVVLVHGSGSDYRTWEAQRPAFRARHRTIAYSRRYHWPNPPIADGVDYAMLQHVEDLEAVLSALGAVPAHLVGHSYGAVLCLLLATRRPQAVRSMVLGEPPVVRLLASNVPKPTELLWLLVTRPRTAAALVRFGVKGVVPARKAFQRGDTETGIRAFGGVVFGAGGYDRFPPSRRRQVEANRGNIRAELLGSGFAPLEPDRVRRVQAPTLLVAGEGSVALFRLLLDRLEELVPNTARVAIPRAGHAMHEDNPAKYNEVVLAFLARHGSS